MGEAHLSEPPFGGYDQVVVPSSAGGTRTLSRREFESLPLRERVQFLMEGSAQFFSRGVAISARTAMKR